VPGPSTTRPNKGKAPTEFPLLPSENGDSSDTPVGGGGRRRPPGGGGLFNGAAWFGGGSGGGGPPGDFGPNTDNNAAQLREFMMAMCGDRLKGPIPKPFFSNHRDTARFLTAFDCYSFLNHTATIISDPMKRTAFFLGFMEGNALPWAE